MSSSFQKLERHLGDARANINRGLRQFEEAMAEAEQIEQTVKQLEQDVKVVVADLESTIRMRDEAVRLERQLREAADERAGKVLEVLRRTVACWAGVGDTLCPHYIEDARKLIADHDGIEHPSPGEATP